MQSRHPPKRTRCKTDIKTYLYTSDVVWTLGQQVFHEGVNRGFELGACSRRSTALDSLWVTYITNYKKLYSRSLHLQSYYVTNGFTFKLNVTGLPSGNNILRRGCWHMYIAFDKSRNSKSLFLSMKPPT